MLQLRNNSMVVGRAATGIYLIFQIQKKKGKVLYPANICYAAIYPAIYAGMSPIFCDTDPKSGNVTYKIVEKVLRNEPDICAMVIPHMYGNPVTDIGQIQDICHKRGILLVEDCASAMGATIGGKQIGCYGDYVIYSTGYAKTIDLGYGGIVSSDLPLDSLHEIYRRLPLYSSQIEENEAFFSKIYRLVRNNEKQTISKYIFAGLRENLKDMFVYRINTDLEEKLISHLCDLEKIVDQRRMNLHKYQTYIKECSLLEQYVFEDGAVPWRFNLLVSPKIRKDLITYLLEKSVPVSDWYPSVSEMFGDIGEYIGVSKIEHEIINFPLLLPEVEIKRICFEINRFMEDADQ